ncbi:hypothetical protein SAZ11_28960 [Streptomyces sp. FXJ1.4098]|nr:hypothetical protein [Streptomyces sp. FXJ1.4098]
MNGRDGDRAASHTIPGVGKDARALAEYFAGFKNAEFTHIDTKINEGTSQAYALYDADKGVAIIKNAYMIHGYKMSPEAFAKRYESIG